MIRDAIDRRFERELDDLRRAFAAESRQYEPAPPSTLYHYTDLRGLTGIISSGTLWATLSSCLNDERELSYAAGVLREVLAEEAAGLRDAPREMLLPRQVLEFDFARQDALLVYVASLTVHPDHPRQWCMYAREGNGVAIGFASDAFRRFESQESRNPYFGLGQVVYEPHDQRMLLRRGARLWLSSATRQLRKLVWALLFEGRYVRASAYGNLAAAFANYLPFIKEFGWAPENEWRLAHGQNPKNPDCQVKYRGTARLPYVPLDIRQADGRLPITELVVGPAFATDRSVSTLHAFLDSCGYSDVRVTASAIPSARPRDIRMRLTT